MFFSAPLRRTFLGAATLQGEHQNEKFGKLRQTHKMQQTKTFNLSYVCVCMHCAKSKGCVRGRLFFWQYNNKTMTRLFVAKILLRIKVKNVRTARGSRAAMLLLLSLPLLQLWLREKQEKIFGGGIDGS